MPCSTPTGPASDTTERSSLDNIVNQDLEYQDNILYQEFEYQHLDPSSSEIRLLVLKPGARDGFLQCELQHAFLDDKPTYEAVSYCWGDAASRCHILLCGKVVNITTNVRDALLRFRHECDPRTLWVDALCIDQEDLDERCQQVQKMSEIYTSAKAILAWTGEAEENSEAGVHLLMELAMLLSKNGINFRKQITAACLQEAGFDIAAKPWASLDHLLDREYWYRIWVIQELALNLNDVSIFFGEYTIPGIVFGAGCLSYQSLLFYHSSKIEKLHGSFSGRRLRHQAFDMSLFTSPHRSKDLQSLIGLTFNYKATDPRDRVYAILSLAEEEDRKALLPDYRKSEYQLRQDVAVHLIRTGRSLRYLDGNRADPEGQSFVHPSWGVDLMRNDTKLGVGGKLMHDPFYAGGMATPSLRLSDTSGSLIIRGLSVDTIDLVVGPFDYERGDSDRQMAPFLRSLLKLQSRFSRTGEDEYIWRTLLMDSMLEHNGVLISPAPKVFAQVFEYLGALNNAIDADEVNVTPDPLMEEEWQRFLNACEYNLKDQCFFTTSLGEFGIGPRATKKSDSTVVFYGARVCHVLRPVNDHYLLLGDASIHGIMQGELMNASDRDERERFFELR
jgi:hypothetical protein